MNYINAVRDRTFNLKIKNSLKILEFFLERMAPDLFLHFEVVPDHLPDALKDMIAKFPAGSLQFEIGIQTFNPDVQARISRRQDNQKAKDNLVWIRDNTEAYIHADLIFGLPSETIDSFAQSFNDLYQLKPHEIQVGILKRLKGSPIIRHTQEHKLVFNPNPPFSILSSDVIDYQSVQKINRFARYWDLIGNSGRFKNTLGLLLGEQPFNSFAVLTDSLFARSAQTHKISLLRLYDFVFDIGIEDLQLEATILRNAIDADFKQSGLKSIPVCLRQHGSKQKSTKQNSGSNPQLTVSRNSRQSRH